MKTNRTILAGCICALGLAHIPLAGAEEAQSVDCSPGAYTGKAFLDLYQSASETAKQLCKELGRSGSGGNTTNDAQVGSALADFGARAERALNGRGMQRSADYHAQFQQLTETFSAFNSEAPILPTFGVETEVGTIEGYFRLVEEEHFTIRETDHCASIITGASCEDVFEDFGEAFNAYKAPYDRRFDNTKTLSKLAADWDEFLEVSKSQSAFEVLLTTTLQRDHFQTDHLVGPPKYQIIAFHPHLIYNAMDDVPDGNEQEMGMAVEWAGINFWDWKLPLGISFSSVYADRALADDVGHGVMVHVNNRYSFGWADHGDEESVYVTMDLLTLFSDKKKTYDRYMSRL